MDDKFLIQLSLRYKTNYYLWFSFFYEAGHVLLHGKNALCLFENDVFDPNKEEDANIFARNFLIPNDLFVTFIKNSSFTLKNICHFAKSMNIAPGIVVEKTEIYPFEQDVFDFLMELYEKRIQEGDPFDKYFLGLMYLRDRQCDRAVNLIEQAASQGLVDAQVKLALMYYNVEFVSQNYRKSCAWLRKAAMNGNSIAKSNLGTMYYFGKGLRKSYYNARFWFKKAAKQNFAMAQYNLGIMYYNGDNVEQDYTEAKKYFLKACLNGYHLGCIKYEELLMNVFDDEFKQFQKNRVLR